MANKETDAQRYAKVVAMKWGTKSKPPKGIMAQCCNCKKSTFHQWVNGNIKDPMVCECTFSGEWNMASCPMERCAPYEYDPKWEKRMEHPIIHRKNY